MSRSFPQTKALVQSRFLLMDMNSIQFNVVSKNLGCDRMSFFLNEAANDLRDLMMPTVGAEKAKL